MTANENDTAYHLDKREIRRAFDHASGEYDDSAVLQSQVRNRLLERLSLIKIDPARCLDLGTGTGRGAAALAKRYRNTRVCAVDLTLGMLTQARKNKPRFRKLDLVCGDAAMLPYKDACFDLVFCNLMLQWCNDLDGIFREMRRVISPEGFVTFTTFGPDTLHELRNAFSQADDHAHVNRFVDMHDIGDALVRAGLAEPVMDVEYFTLTYEDVIDLMRDLKAIGAHNAADGRPRGLMSRGRFATVTAAYERYRQDGKLPATYEVVYGHAWAPPPGAGIPLTDGAAHVPLDQILRRRPR